jgi:hypothetical protein
LVIILLILNEKLIFASLLCFTSPVASCSLLSLRFPVWSCAASRIPWLFFARSCSTVGRLICFSIRFLGLALDPVLPLFWHSVIFHFSTGDRVRCFFSATCFWSRPDLVTARFLLRSLQFCSHIGFPHGCCPVGFYARQARCLAASFLHSSLQPARSYFAAVFVTW